MSTLFQPPAFPSETPESIKKYIEETYLQPRLDPDDFSPEKVGRQWEFDWFDRAKVPLEPSLPRTMVVPVWEPPFRRSNNGSVKGRAFFFFFQLRELHNVFKMNRRLEHQ